MYEDMNGSNNTQNAGGYWQNESQSQGQVWQTTPQGASGGNGGRKERRKKSGIGTGRLIAIALCCALLGGVVGAGGTVLGERFLLPKAEKNLTTVLQGQRPTAAINVANIDTSKLMTPAEVYAANVNSTVGITTSVTTNFFGYQTTSAASGSGFILTADGYIVTNQHVIDSANEITVTTYDGTAYEAQLIGFDESSDIAVLKVDATGLVPVVLGDSTKANVGDNVVAIGNPLGELTFSLASGVISALNRSITLSSGTTMDLMQVDCAINAGNSGGALFNLYGEVIGVTNAKYSNNGNSSEASIENIGFAIPISNVRGIIESIIEKGYISKPYIGVSVGNVGSQLQAYGVPVGAAVGSVTEDGPAEKAGLQINDVITSVNGTEITDGSQLVEIVRSAAIGDELKMTVYRQGEYLDLTVIVEENRQSALAEDEDQTQQSQQGGGQQGSQGGGNFVFPWSFFGF